jgi:hypothetical protein
VDGLANLQPDDGGGNQPVQKTCVSLSLVDMEVCVQTYKVDERSCCIVLGFNVGSRVSKKIFLTVKVINKLITGMTEKCCTLYKHQEEGKEKQGEWPG